MLGFNLAIGQTAVEGAVSLVNGDIKVTGTDPFGALVSVTYNSDKHKIYQERVLNGETTYAYFNQGQVTEYGTIITYLGENVNLEEDTYQVVDHYRNALIAIDKTSLNTLISVKLTPVTPPHVPAYVQLLSSIVANGS